jgi:hypothetical protein
VSLAVVLHDVGDPAGGAAWRDALPNADWEAPDLPGHGAAPAPRNGAYDPSTAWTLARWRVAAHGIDDSLVVGVGGNALAALMVACGEACSSVAIVDGLWGPWPEAPAERVDVMYDHIRAVLADPAATAGPPPSGLDPRAAHGYTVVATPRLIRRAWGCIEVPVLVVETPASTTPPEERTERLAWFGGPTTLVEVHSEAPRTVVPAIAAWWGRSAERPG